MWIATLIPQLIERDMSSGCYDMLKILPKKPEK